jgi:hypothetical protein
MKGMPDVDLQLEAGSSPEEQEAVGPVVEGGASQPRSMQPAVIVP